MLVVSLLVAKVVLVVLVPVLLLLLLLVIQVSLLVCYYVITHVYHICYSTTDLRSCTIVSARAPKAPNEAEGKPVEWLSGFAGFFLFILSTPSD